MIYFSFFVFCIVTGKKFDVTRTTASELLKEYQNSTASGFEKGILGLKAIVASMGPTDLELLKVERDERGERRETRGTRGTERDERKENQALPFIDRF